MSVMNEKEFLLLEAAWRNQQIRSIVSPSSVCRTSFSFACFRKNHQNTLNPSLKQEPLSFFRKLRKRVWITRAWTWHSIYHKKSESVHDAYLNLLPRCIFPYRVAGISLGLGIEPTNHMLRDGQWPFGWELPGWIQSLSCCGIRIWFWMQDWSCFRTHARCASPPWVSTMITQRSIRQKFVADANIWIWFAGRLKQKFFLHLRRQGVVAVHF